MLESPMPYSLSHLPDHQALILHMHNRKTMNITCHGLHGSEMKWPGYAQPLFRLLLSWWPLYNSLSGGSSKVVSSLVSCPCSVLTSPGREAFSHNRWSHQNSSQIEFTATLGCIPEFFATQPSCIFKYCCLCIPLCRLLPPVICPLSLARNTQILLKYKYCLSLQYLSLDKVET